MTEIRAIVSDFGGVLTTPLLPAFMALQDEIGVAPEHFATALRTVTEERGENPLFEMERGEITEVEFLELLGRGLEPLLDHEPHLHRFRELFIGGLDANPEMIDLMAELRDQGLRMAMLTNNVREWEELWRAKLPVDEIFETVVDSAFVGCRKPESRIYAITLERIELPPRSCLFVDDVQVNCEGAERAGMRAVHFRDNEQAIAEIRAALPGSA
ncbi:MAG TPA: HAD family phosphatase [Solirubrobacterales bacterium]|nr:HAD family phosphatase [Solirubrobacterales bacterium]